MNIFKLTLSYMRAKSLNTFLNIVLLAMGIATITMLMLGTSQLDESMQRDAKGFDLVVGAKGSPMQLILSSIYHVDVPTGNIPLAEAEKIKSLPVIKKAIPLALGDSFRGFRIVGTTPAYIDHYEAGFTQGKFWDAPFQIVLGAEVARKTGLKLGDQFTGSHGIAEGGTEHADEPYVVVGILKENDSVLDRLMLTSFKSVWLAHDAHHEEQDKKSGANERDKHTHKEHDDDHHEEHGDEGKEITALLIQYASPVAAASLPRQINSQSALQAASPAFETARLMKIAGVGIDVLQIFSVLLILSAGLSIFIALYNALKERRYDLAILRTLGASRSKILFSMLLESWLLVLAGALLGLILGHIMTELLGIWLRQSQQIPVTGMIWMSQELGLVVIALLVGTIAALLPAFKACRIDVAKILAKG